MSDANVLCTQRHQSHVLLRALPLALAVGHSLSGICRTHTPAFQARCSCRLPLSICACNADDQLAVAQADVEFAADGKAQLFQPAAA